MKQRAQPSSPLDRAEKRLVDSRLPNPEKLAEQLGNMWGDQSIRSLYKDIDDLAAAFIKLRRNDRTMRINTGVMWKYAYKRKVTRPSFSSRIKATI